MFEMWMARLPRRYAARRAYLQRAVITALAVPRLITEETVPPHEPWDDVHMAAIADALEMVVTGEYAARLRLLRTAWHLRS